MNNHLCKVLPAFTWSPILHMDKAFTHKFTNKFPSVETKPMHSFQYKSSVWFWQKPNTYTENTDSYPYFLKCSAFPVSFIVNFRNERVTLRGRGSLIRSAYKYYWIGRDYTRRESFQVRKVSYFRNPCTIRLQLQSV